ncbi:hypothetical protein J6590_010884 [Homalodisca vitripennis]|nr:hypothetical protein J6590_010884 [Homalodisca vitripennis]
MQRIVSGRTAVSFVGGVPQGSVMGPLFFSRPLHTNSTHQPRFGVMCKHVDPTEGFGDQVNPLISMTRAGMLASPATATNPRWYTGQMRPEVGHGLCQHHVDVEEERVTVLTSLSRAHFCQKVKTVSVDLERAPLTQSLCSARVSCSWYILPEYRVQAR